jgi:hypothetical protein
LRATPARAKLWRTGWVDGLLKRSSHLALVLVAAALTVAGGAEPAAAAEPQVIGQVGGAGTPGGCTCSLFQRTTGGSPGYVFPFSGILTKARVFVGEETQSGDTVQARTFRVLSASNASVINGGEAHSLSGLPPEAPSAFVDRIPATAGDQLGARFAVGPFVRETPRYFTTASATDVMSAGAVDVAIGGSFSTSPTSNARVNIEAVLEHDEDGDGYGDNSQDLCLGSPIATSACSGTLFGSNLQGERSTPPQVCHSCMLVQKKMGGVSTAVPFDGVVVRWRVLDGTTGTYRARVVVPNPEAGDATHTGYRVLHSSAAESVTAPTQPLFSKISTFQTRLPIPAGAYVALSAPPYSEQGFQASSGAATYDEPEDGGDGISVRGLTHNGTVLYDADIEPDADHDGYGDITQDECPTDASTQGACPPASVPSEGTPTDASTQGAGVGVRPPASRLSAKTPAISHFKAVPAKFRIEKGGAVVSRRRPHAGTTLELELSEPATVAFTMERSAPCRHARKKRKGCARWVFVHTFKRNLHRGSSSLPYSGRYRRGGKVHSLKPGSYRMSAVPTGATGKAGATASIRLTVLP